MANKEYYSFKSEYEDVPDEELIKLVHSGDKNALDFLIGKYNDIVSMKANKFFINFCIFIHWRIKEWTSKVGKSC